MELPKVATNILIFCKKCDSERYHKVLTHVNSNTAKVECEVCHSKKTYKLPKPESLEKLNKPKRAPSKKSAANLEAMHLAAYEELKDKYGGQAPLAYNMKEKYSVGAPIKHSSFGLGFVQKVEAKKIEVVFPDFVKDLVHAR